MSETGIELPKRKRNADDGELDVTPMIDVTFLLLAFFVVVSKMDPQASVPLPTATYGEGISEKNAVTVFLVLDPADPEKADIYLGKKNEETLMADGEEEDIIEQIGEFIESEFFANPSKEFVVLKAGANCKTRMVEMVKKGIANSELAKSRKLYVGIEEKN